MKKFLSMALAMLMVVSMIPMGAVTAFAGDVSEKEEFTVTFDYAGHGGVDEPKEVKVEAGKTVDEPEAPTDEAYDFEGWFILAAAEDDDKAADGEGADGEAAEKKEDEKFDFDTEITEDITLTAKWTEKKSDDEGEGKSDAETGDKTDETEKVELSFNMNGHGDAIDPQQVVKGEAGKAPEADPEAEGFTFGGWFTEEACENEFDFDSKLDKDTVVYAKWTEAKSDESEDKPGEEETTTFTVKFENTDASVDCTMPSDQSVKEGESAQEPAALTATGYRFKGWFADAEGKTAFDFEEVITADTTVYACWEKVDPVAVKSFTVHFDGNLPEVSGIEADKTVNEGKPVIKPADPTATGYKFVCWTTDPEGNNKYDFETPVTADMTLYAKWVEQFVVSFNVNNGSSANTYEDQKILSGGKAAKPAADPTADGFKFTGWFTDDQGTNKYDFDSAVTKDTVIYAGWVKLYSVKFSVSRIEASKIPETQKVVENEKAAKPENPTCKGYTFDGWYTDQQLTQQFDFATPITQDMILYDRWTVEEYRIDFNANGYGTAPASQTVKYGDRVAIPAAMSANGVTFEGWYTDQGGSNRYDFSQPVTGNMTLYAKWLDQNGRVVSNGGKGPGAQTGDTQNIAVFYGLGAVAVIGLGAAGFVLYKKKKTTED